jgi:hypothetical protein
MNLPYTMSVAAAADAIRQFKPKVVYPYHYRSHDGTKADFEELKRLVGEGVEIRVIGLGSGMPSRSGRAIGRGERTNEDQREVRVCGGSWSARWTARRGPR